MAICATLFVFLKRCVQNSAELASSAKGHYCTCVYKCSAPACTEGPDTFKYTHQCQNLWSVVYCYLRIICLLSPPGDDDEHVMWVMQIANAEHQAVSHNHF